VIAVVAQNAGVGGGLGAGKVDLRQHPVLKRRRFGARAARADKDPGGQKDGETERVSRHGSLVKLDDYCPIPIPATSNAIGAPGQCDHSAQGNESGLTGTGL
jgi:hypothetical protein